ncbi:ABC transporter ATP-binding protein [Klenkia sp. LSe6-5]|uniref:ABC transporter ATP-binding protein n=1 Tax=Klenkia sesuvii TaxID=3103137 RepID=A0ABU8E0F7_9ACTN
MMIAEAVLGATNLSKSFNLTAALRGATLSISEGEIAAIVGPSGSGKSTLMHCLAGILTPDSGEVLFRGRRVDDLSETKRTQLRRDQYGFVFQYSQLVEELTARENIALPLVLRGKSRRRALMEADRWLQRLGIDSCSERRPSQLSGGQGQRVAVARAMISRPAVVFADEPTGSLDTAAGELVLSLLIESARRHKAAILLVTHDQTVAARADRVINVQDGIVEDRVMGRPL